METRKDLERRDFDDLAFQDIYNPMKMFHQLKRLDFEQDVALKIARHYEDLFYRPLIKLYFTHENK